MLRWKALGWRPIDAIRSMRLFATRSVSGEKGSLWSPIGRSKEPVLKERGDKTPLSLFYYGELQLSLA